MLICDFNYVTNSYRKDEEKKQAVGWPPIESWRKKAFHWHTQPPQTIDNRRPIVADHQSNQNGGQNSLFVKVKMEGVAIARKLDLKLYHSHHSLKTALITMFTTSNSKFPYTFSANNIYTTNSLNNCNYSKKIYQLDSLLTP